MLNIYKNLFQDLNESNIQYCHFKSNDHLAAGLNGLTDLDILVHPNDATRFLTILLKHDFKRTEAGFGVKNHSREGYLGFDFKTGQLVYIDLHYCIVIGANRIREYSLREYSINLLENRHLDKKYNVFIASPEYEFFLLMLRACLKIRIWDGIKLLFGFQFFDDSWKRQHDWLSKRSLTSKLKKVVSQNFTEESINTMIQMFTHYPNTYLLFRNKLIFKKHFYSSRKYGQLTSIIGMLLKELHGAICYFNRKFFSNIIPINRRYLSKGGKFVAFVGVDGSGKSTQLKTISKIFSWKLDLATVYLGAGDGKASWHRSGLIKLKSCITDKNKHSRVLFREKPTKVSGLLRKAAKFIWAISLYLEKNSKLKKYHRLSKRGILVLSDRYPQNNVLNFNDGPLLSDYLNEPVNKLFKKFAEYEQNIYSSKKFGPPDLLIRLLVDPMVSIERGEAGSVDYLKRRIAAVNSINFGKNCKEVSIDASRSVEEVARDISREIWRVL